MRIYDKSYELAKKFASSDDFRELLSIKDEIQLNLKSLVDSFKETQAKYEEAKKTNLPVEIKKWQTEFSKAKAALFSEELVGKYHELERTIQSNLNVVTKQITKAITNRFASEGDNEHEQKESSDNLL